MNISVCATHEFTLLPSNNKWQLRLCMPPRYMFGIIKLRPWFTWRGFLLCICMSVYLCVCPFARQLDNNDPINLIFGGSLLSDPRRRLFDFEKKSARVRVDVGCVCRGGGSKLGPNDKRYDMF